MSAPDMRVTLSVAFSLNEIYRALGRKNDHRYATTDELVAALSDSEVQTILTKLSSTFGSEI